MTKGIVICEDEYVRTVEFQTKAELDAYRQGLDTGAELGACSCFMFDLDDLTHLTDPVDAKFAELVRRHCQ